MNNFLAKGLTLVGMLLCGVANSQVLFDQTFGCLANSGNALSSRFLRSTNVEAADDFVVPAGKIWRPNRVVAQGNQNILNAQVRVNIYADTEDFACLIGAPCPDSLPTSNPLCSVTGTAQEVVQFPIGFNPFAVDLPQDFCQLDEGRYWLSLTYVNNLCGIIAPCQDWAWDETQQTNATREWVIRDIGNTSAEVTCSGFGLGSSCQSQPVQNNLCFDLEGQSENNLPPIADPELLVETLVVGDALKIDTAPSFIEPNGQPLSFSSPELAPFLELDSDGVLVSNNEESGDPVSKVRATDPAGLSDDLLVAVRVIDPDTVGFDGPFTSDKLLRCGQGNQSLAEGLDFSTSTNCAKGAPASSCEPVPEQAVVINAELQVEIEHPMVSDLALRLQNPAGTEVVVMNRPNFSEFAVSPSGGCNESDVNAVFSDTHVWPVEQQCTSPVAVLGDLEPQEQLAAFRNQPGVGPEPWRLQVDNAGEEGFAVNQWCVALQIQPNGAPIYPQAQLPGSATVVDMRSTDEVTLQGTLQGPEDIHWFLVFQNTGQPGDNAYQELDTRITPATGQILRSHRYSNEKFGGFNPTMAIGDCRVSRELIYPRYQPRRGRELIRIAGCGGSAAGEYSLNIVKNTAGFSFADLPSGVGFLVGQARDAVSGEPVPRAYVTSNGSSAFAGATGDFNAALLVGAQTVSVFHPDYLPLSFDTNIVEGGTLEAGTLMLTPTSYPAVTNQIIFETGFE